jgi:hypothetical protein
VLEPGAYTVLVAARDEPPDDATRGYTLRAALGPPTCATERDPTQRYAVALAIEPEQPGRYDLITFSAFLAPPFGDLFDYEWQVDGQQVGGAGAVAQRAAVEIAPSAGGEHRVRVVVRGARAYPDPAQSQTPPTLAVECTFRVG